MLLLIKKLKDKLYFLFVDKNINIANEYNNYVRFFYDEHLSAPWKHWGILIKLNLHYRILKKTSKLLTQYNTTQLVYPESSAIKRPNITTLVNKLSKYDVISFDIFDTLIFRPFSKPTDLFYLLGCQNGLIDFTKCRQMAEAAARKKTSKPNMEINIFDIYEELKNFYDINAYELALQEINLEKQICYPNPYIKEIYDELIKLGKTIIATSDMYIPQKYITSILNHCGYNEFKDIFVSCEYGVYKADGQLQRIVQKACGEGKKIIHIDDTARCVNGCKLAGWDTIYYQQCNEIGNKYRLWYLNNPALLMYNGIINNHIHCGFYKHNKVEEFGYIYGGIAVCGYCEWITTFCKENKCDKILFLARDMDIFSKVYKNYYNEIPNDYVYVSRNALQELVFDHYIYEFISHVIDVRVGLEKTIDIVLNETDLSLLKPYVEEYGIKLSDILNARTRDEVVQMIIDHREEIAIYFNKANEAVKQYFKKIINEKHKICVSGLGWIGSEIAYLRYLVQVKWKLNVEIIGTVFGSMTNTRATELISSGIITPYVFSNNKNRALALDINSVPEEIVRLVIEFIFSSKEPSLLKYSIANKNLTEVRFIFKESNPNASMIDAFQIGVLKFVDEFFKHRKPFYKWLFLEGVDAYEPLYRIIANTPYIAETLGQMKELPRLITGNCNDKQYITLRQTLELYNLNTHYITNDRSSVTKVNVNETKYFKFRRHLQNCLNKQLRKQILDHLINKADRNCKNFYLYKHHIGEIYIYLNLIEYLLKQNNSTNSVLVINEKRYIPLYKMFVPNLKTIYFPLDSKTMDDVFTSALLEYRGYKFYSPTPDRFEKFRYMLFHSSEKLHFYDYIKNSMGIPNNVFVRFHKPVLSHTVQNNALQKAKKIKLNLQKYVMIFPEAVTATRLTSRFWNSLCDTFRKNGYDVLLNSVGHDYDELNAKTADFNIAEAYYFAEKSKGIFALVNGLVVTYSMLETPRYIFYTDQTPTVGERMTAEIMLNAYRISNLPNCYTNTLFEINLNEVCEQNLFKKILGDYKLS